MNLIELAKLVIDHSVRGLCKKSYHGHPRGCPNHGSRPTCPPQAPLIEDVIDMNKDTYVIFNIFPFGEHVERMRLKQPGWSERQLACCLYWQNTARKQLREQIKVFEACYHNNLDWLIIQCPEACGVNITATMATIGHNLEWPPKVFTYQVAVAGIRLKQCERVNQCQVCG